MIFEREPDMEGARAAAAQFLPEATHVEPTSSAPEPDPEPAAQPGPSASEQRESRAALAAAIAILLDKVTQSWALKYGEHWNMDEAERTAIAGPLCEIAERELGLLGDTPEDRLLLAVGVYGVPRLLISLTSKPTAPASTSSTIEVSGERVS